MVLALGRFYFDPIEREKSPQFTSLYICRGSGYLTIFARTR